MTESLIASIHHSIHEFFSCLFVFSLLIKVNIEQLVNLVSPQRHPLAGRVKDIAAGAVLVCTATAAIIGLIIFIPYLTRLRL